VINEQGVLVNHTRGFLYIFYEVKCNVLVSESAPNSYPDSIGL
jgi:hypothetical protein